MVSVVAQALLQPIYGLVCNNAVVDVGVGYGVGGYLGVVGGGVSGYAETSVAVGWGNNTPSRLCSSYRSVSHRNILYHFSSAPITPLYCHSLSYLRHNHHLKTAIL